MTCSLQTLWGAGGLLCLGLLVFQSAVHTGEAGVLTEVQSGPLYRVINRSLSISCNTSGFRDANAKQEFQFRIHKVGHPLRDLQIISTNDVGFTYNFYRKRVMKNEITVAHVAPTSVLFTIKKLEESDDGEYECFVVNSEKSFYGTYAAKTTVKVIGDSLTISSPDTAPLSLNEGDMLTLTCQASTNTVQHTHLSVTWYLHREKEDSARPIISLDKDFILIPGEAFEGRYQSGLIALDKVGAATYRLKIAKLELSDSGRIYCQAQEWIQDPDRSWFSILQKDAQATTLNVKAKGLVLDKGSLSVRMSVQQATLQEGQELAISCSVDTDNPAGQFFSVAWLRDSVELAKVGPTGVLSIGPEYSIREKGGELRATRTRDRDHQLILRPVRTQDQGEYRCRAWPEDRGPDGAFTQGAAQESSPLPVTISATASGLSVEMVKTDVGVDEGDVLRLTCKVNGVKGQLSVSWQHSASRATQSSRNVITLSREGVVEPGVDFGERNITAMRPATDTFTLVLDEATRSDAGVYQCVVSEWTVGSNGKISATNSQSQSGTVAVTPLESSLKVTLKSRGNIATIGEDVELVCRVQGPRLPMTLTWTLQRSGASSPDSILTLRSNGAIAWWGDQRRFQIKTTVLEKAADHTLIINGASSGEAGLYQCQVSVFLEKSHRRMPPSNLLAVMVNNPVSKLSLTSSPAVRENINADVELKCSAVKTTSAVSRLSVSWLVDRPAENSRLILTSDHDAVVTFGAQGELSDAQRISMKRGEGRSFELTIRKARIRDGGTYRCVVAEWLQDSRGQWYELSSVNKTTVLEIMEAASDLGVGEKEQQMMTVEGNDLELNCTLTSGGSDPSLLYTFTWFYTGPDPVLNKRPLVKLDYSGLLRYPESQELLGLQGRLRLSRPTRNNFHLGIKRAQVEDSGTYQCQVEQYQLDHQGSWQQKTLVNSGPVTLAVKATEINLAVAREDAKLNTTGPQHFTVPCNITAKSSQSSTLQVTWFWQQHSGSERLPIFMVYRNSTLQDRSGKGERLRFEHPAPNRFSLTVSKPVPEDGGLYFCEVEEWLLSPSRGWRKVAAEVSGELSVSVSTEEETGFSVGTLPGVLAGFIVCLLLVVVLLVLKIRRGRVAKKPADSLWADEPLKERLGADA
ncbi:immunoglobulin superfamily member 3-like [Lampris incognitus]|uniref:immunoglobulin superfamily member 3-like n=1 Tax=Lampris incognitus TaxID=2546036 RepID=UPI0024B4F51F|nr:immunoglobulin superfamily member 3-like [Lampris incognitus]